MKQLYRNEKNISVNDNNDISHNNYDTTSTYVLWFNTYLYQKNS